MILATLAAPALVLGLLLLAAVPLPDDVRVGIAIVVSIAMTALAVSIAYLPISVFQNLPERWQLFLGALLAPFAAATIGVSPPALADRATSGFFAAFGPLLLGVTVSYGLELRLVPVEEPSDRKARYWMLLGLGGAGLSALALSFVAVRFDFGNDHLQAALLGHIGYTALLLAMLVTVISAFPPRTVQTRPAGGAVAAKGSRTAVVTVSMSAVLIVFALLIGKGPLVYLLLVAVALFALVLHACSRCNRAEADWTTVTDLRASAAVVLASVATALFLAEALPKAAEIVLGPDQREADAYEWTAGIIGGLFAAYAAGYQTDGKPLQHRTGLWSGCAAVGVVGVSTSGLALLGVRSAEIFWLTAVATVVMGLAVASRVSQRMRTAA